jgi:hypothetical protein
MPFIPRLNDRIEAFDRVGADRHLIFVLDVFVGAVNHAAVLVELLAKAVIRCSIASLVIR